MPLTVVKKYRFVPYAIILAAILLAYFFPNDELMTLIVFIVVLIVFFVCKFDSRIFIGSAVLLFIIQGVLTAQNQDVSVEVLAVISYWLLVDGIVYMIIDLYRKKAPSQTVG